MTEFKFSKEQLDAIALLREAGCAVVVFDPEELKGVEDKIDDIEERLIELGWDVIEYWR